jgi:hypothetical protein
MTGGRTVVCRVAVGGRSEVCATYLFGSPLTTLAAEQGDLPGLLAARQARVADPDGPLAGEAGQVELLARYSRVPVCTPIGTAGGVQLTCWVCGPTLADRLAATPQDTGTLLSGVLAVLEGLHTDPAVPLRRAARLAAPRQIPAVLVRVLGAGSQQWLAGVSPGWAAPDTADQLRTVGLRTVGRLGRLTHRLDPDLTGGVCFGALSPQHVIYPEPSRPVLVSPALSTGGEAVDVGMLLGRLHLFDVGPTAPADVTAGVADGIRTWLGQLAAARPPGWVAVVLTVWAADVLATLAGWLSLPPGVLPLPPGAMVAAHRRAADVLATLDTVTAALTDRDTDTALRTALNRLPPPRPRPLPGPGPVRPAVRPGRTRPARHRAGIRPLTTPGRTTPMTPQPPAAPATPTGTDAVPRRSGANCSEPALRRQGGPTSTGPAHATFRSVTAGRAAGTPDAYGRRPRAPAGRHRGGRRGARRNDPRVAVSRCPCASSISPGFGKRRTQPRCEP